jgi:hypothetical protein
MFVTPQLSQIPYDILAWSGIGYAIGRFAEVNAKLAAEVLVIATLANHILFQMANQWIAPKFQISSEAIYTATNAVIAMTTILVCQQLELISRRMAGCLVFTSLAVLLARLKIIAA